MGTVIDNGQTLKRIRPMTCVDDGETVASNDRFKEFFSDTLTTHSCYYLYPYTLVNFLYKKIPCLLLVLSHISP